jgi:hypothetical protein
LEAQVQGHGELRARGNCKPAEYQITRNSELRVILGIKWRRILSALSHPRPLLCMNRLGSRNRACAKKRDDEHAAADPDRVPSSRRTNWASVHNRGWMSTRRLMELCGGIEYGASRHHRPASRRLASDVLIRDQRLMPPKALMRCLRSGLMPEDWFELLNSKVFFWLDPKGRLCSSKILRASVENHI